MFEGHLVALVTPFREGALDLDAFREHVDRMIQGGVHGLVPCGTTGESPTLTDSERELLIRACVERSRGRIPVVAGAGTNNTATSIRYAKMAEEVGADGVLVVTPYYNKPPQEGLYRHFKEIADATVLPVVLYNVPSRTAVDLQPETVERLAKHERIVAIKEAKGDLDRAKRLLEIEGLTVLSGDDAMTVPMRELGAHGVVSVAGNVVPDRISEMCEADLPRARAIHGEMSELFRALFLETSPIPTKAALEELGQISAEVRLPLCPISGNARGEVKRVLKSLGLL